MQNLLATGRVNSVGCFHCTALLGLLLAACSSAGSSGGGQGGLVGSSGNAGVSGSSGVGGASGVGGGQAGNSSGTPAKALAYGFTPSTVTLEAAANGYAEWKATLLDTSCGGGVCRVSWDTPTYTVSEGIGYGMLMAVAFDDRATFDCLWAYYQAGAVGNPSGSGLMNWEREGCAATKPNVTYPDYAASDGDLDVAMALVMADCRWTGYSTQATQIIKAIQQYEVVNAGGLSMLKPGDNAYWGGADCLNPSYFSPGYYRAFARYAPVSADAAFWETLADDSYTLLNRMANAATGLVPNWATAAGAASTCANNTDYAVFGWDAIRNPWRVAVDYVWWGTPAAKTYLDRITQWSSGIGPVALLDEYTLDGVPWATPAGGRPAPSHNARASGAWASAALAYDQATADAYVAETVANTNYGPTASVYYPMSLRVLYLMLASGQFTTCGNK
jgi:endo-1,4-beta-D-glucanase Y